MKDATLQRAAFVIAKCKEPNNKNVVAGIAKALQVSKYRAAGVIREGVNAGYWRITKNIKGSPLLCISLTTKGLALIDGLRPAKSGKYRIELDFAANLRLFGVLQLVAKERKLDFDESIFKLLQERVDLGSLFNELTIAERIKLAEKYFVAYADDAKKRKKNRRHRGLLAADETSPHRRRTDTIISKMIGLGKDTYRKAKAVVEAAKHSEEAAVIATKMEATKNITRAYAEARALGVV